MLVNPETWSLLDEVRKDPVAYRMLKDKCNWEQMSITAVLAEWGDPRKWPDYMTNVAALAAKGEQS